MTNVFIGGSRQVSRLPANIKERLNTIIEKGHRVFVGDANGADKAVQKHFADAHYEQVTVFCSGPTPRNNVGHWPTHNVTPPKGVKGFQFYAAKDREMAREADFGLMIWDGKSAGTVLNVLRLVKDDKIAVLVNVPEKATLNIKSADAWRDFMQNLSAEMRDDLRERATADEWAFSVPSPQLGFSLDAELPEPASKTEALESDFAEAINAALSSGDAALFVDALGNVAKARGMSQVAKETGLSRESLYRSLGSGGNPEFGTVLRVMTSLGLRLHAEPAQQASVHQGS
ncbi:MAG: putative addiction module antidote protein [Sphingomonas sp.]|uniref:addiction module antidote protein n=1 Tax=Sphingomonas sp. TaxID=28214 RepID=UPI0025E31BE9|nr:addiction module antidote protein [Sphingomonas sp.]MBQ1499615.1 putative addiction module antidote protein [Sphingomonas sp.]MBQ8106025.1 putative addiction module antidote protein [Afipia sp.]